MCGAASSLSWDYLPGVPQGEAAERRVSWKEKPVGGLIARALRLPIVPSPTVPPTGIKTDEESCSTQSGNEKDEQSMIESVNMDIPTIVVVAEPEPASNLDVQVTPRTSPAPAVSKIRSGRLTIAIPTTPLRPSVPPTPLRVSVPPTPMRVSVPSTPGFATAPSSPWRGGYPASPVRSIAATIPIRAVHSIHSLEDPTVVAALDKYEPSEPRHWILKLLKPLTALLKPVSVSLIISLPIALVTPLKALFVDASAQGGPNWHGPDGRPPLAFIMDTGTPRKTFVFLHNYSHHPQHNSSTPSRSR